jgi:hypothetical protein
MVVVSAVPCDKNSSTLGVRHGRKELEVPWDMRKAFLRTRTHWMGVVFAHMHSAESTCFEGQLEEG